VQPPQLRLAPHANHYLQTALSTLFIAIFIFIFFAIVIEIAPTQPFSNSAETRGR